ncbi:PAS domain-containing protein [Limibacillus halophilus]|uniref:PAS domain-containing protein n=1 Tax=Limibacillus halophilus TaxID=1579333 RepID=UPI00160B2279|nr:PAS domain-containing protein [Limibacillus halophilus]
MASNKRKAVISEKREKARRWPEDARLATLQDFDIFGSEPDVEFEGLAQIAAHLCDAPIGLIVFSDGNRQWIKASVGWSAPALKSAASSGQSILFSQDIQILDDSGKDGTFRKTPFYAADKDLRFYVGVPLLAGDCLPLGMLCVLDYKSRSLKSSQKTALRAVADQVMTLLNRRKDQQRLHSVIDSVPDIFMILASDGTIGFLNDQATTFLGCGKAEGIGRHLVEMPVFKDELALASKFSEVLETPTPTRFEVALKTSGAWLEVATSSAPAGLVIQIRDITDSKRTDFQDATASRALELVSSGATLEEVLDSIARAVDQLMPGVSSSILLLDPDGIHVRHGAAPRLPDSYNKALHGLAIGPRTGSCGTAMYRREPVIVTDIANDPLWEDYKDLAVPHGLRACWSIPVIASNGEVVASFALYWNEPKAPKAADHVMVERYANLVAVAVERHRKDHALKESELRFREIAETIGEVFWISSPKADEIYYVSPLYEKFWGQSCEELYRNPMIWVDAIHEDDRPQVDPAPQEFPNGSYDAQYRVVRPDGSTIWIQDRHFPVYDSQGTLLRVVGVVTDITEQKMAAERLKLQEERYRLAAKIVSDVIWDRDIASNTVWWSDGLPEVFGHDWSDPHTSRQLWREHVHPDDRERVFKELQDLVENDAGFWSMEYRLRRADGKYVNVSNDIVIIRDKNGKAVRMLGCTTDITERKVMEEQVRQSQRLEAVGQITGGVAHDFNNLLTVILSNAEELEENLPPSSSLQALAELTRIAAERGAELISSLLAFSRQQPLNPKPTDVNALISNMANLLRRALGAQISISMRLNGSPAQAMVDSPQLESAILNLCINARDAMPEGGELIIETENVSAASDAVLQKANLQTGDYLLLSVTDNGSGMDAQTLAHAFEPFFTTKEVGKGSGLGLSMVYGFVKQSKGHIDVQSKPAKGTRTRLYFPLAQGDAPQRTHQTRRPRSAAGTERILLVEDDDLVRRNVCSQLTLLGYDVTSVADGHQALRKLEEGRFNLLFTDLVMPGGVSGQKLATEARRLDPALPIIFSSGYSEDAVVGKRGLETGVHLLAKPYRRHQLAETVRKALDTGT